MGVTGGKSDHVQTVAPLPYRRMIEIDRGPSLVGEMPYIRSVCRFGPRRERESPRELRHASVPRGTAFQTWGPPQPQLWRLHKLNLG